MAAAGSGVDADRRQETYSADQANAVCVLCQSHQVRHVSAVTKFHLDLAQLWRCPVSWCTVWKGSPQECMEHVSGVNDVPWIVKTANLEQFVPPWTVHRLVWSDSLKAAHSGISTDILLFSDLHLSLTHHCRVHRRWLPHIAFRKDYMSKLRPLLPVPVVLPSVTVSPSVELKDESPRRTRCAQWWIRQVQVMDGSGCALSVLTIQDPADAQGEVVCITAGLRCSLCHCSWVSWGRSLGCVLRLRPVWLWPVGSDVDSDMVVFPELGVSAIIDSGTDLEDELLMLDDSPGSVAISAAEATVPEVCLGPRGGFDLELAKVLLDVLVMPMILTPIVDPMVDSVVSPAAYPEPPLPVVL